MEKSNKTTFTSESVCAGHPDKVCDAISDAIVDAVLAEDPNGRVAIETLASFNRLVIVGEVTTTAKPNYELIAREQMTRLGYVDKEYNFSENSPVDVHVHAQSPEISVGVDSEGAGDQGMMFGYACNETPELMPLAIALAHALTEAIDKARENKSIPYLKPDGKSQVTVNYENGIPVSIDNVVIAVPHKKEIKIDQVKEDIYKKIVVPVLKKYGYKIDKKNVIVNGTGVWHMGGPAADSGLTGRKIVVDGYGGYARVGGGAFSGKDPSKVDRSGAYAARFIAKNIVANGLADKAEVRLAYVIGGKYPLMQEVETFGTAKKSMAKIQKFTQELIDTSVTGIIRKLDLKRPIYLDTTAYGHFGKPHFPWEQVVSK